ncbi:aldo/keto reductase [Flavobacterium supellecticarium]|uniref:Aldo/keto reductase n=1 Tax=Flavobacterium supellecticarium TaxID=2565924 RepID=A0A4S4A1B8_9FLAO|nr:aldo/keto reductase [Flavobacterium supellecticarium]THF51709.1 aldo/keto reductase [Flavobacterium supellecticarium]
MHKSIPDYTLNNGVTIPEIGFGTWQTPDGATAVLAVQSALENGYRHIDTAAIYGNEKSIGQAIADSGIDRKELFITSKLWNSERGYESTLKAFEKTLSDLQTDYLDLYLIHWPANAKQFSDWKQKNADTWRAFETLYQDGKIKAIGLSNFMVHHLEALLETATVKPVINQIEYHPGYLQMEVVAFCKANDILIEAWSPLGTGKMLNDPTLLEIASNYNVSVAQLCIRWCLQNGTLPLPKSVTPERIKQNLNVYHFEISESDMKRIDALPYIGGSGLLPDEVAF